MGSKTDVWQGTLTLMVLKTLETMRPMHRYGIARRIEQTSGDALALNDGTLYPALLKLEQEGAIRAEWGVSDNNRRAKFYELTRAGRKQLEREARSWEQTMAIVLSRREVCALALVLPASSKGPAPPSASRAFRSFDRVLLLEEKGETSAGVSVGDLNGDGYPDIVAANRGDYPDLVEGKPVEGPHVPTPSFVCLNDGKGHFPSCEALPTESATSIVAADFDGDGALDLFVPHRDGGQSIILWNDGKGHFPTSTKVGPSAAWIRIAAAADFDGDGHLDLAIIDEQKKAAYVIFNHGGRKFSDPVQLPGPQRTPYALAVADLNRDGRPDIIVGWVEQPGSVYYNTGQGQSFHEVPWNDGKGVVYGMAFADFNGDGWPDIVAARSDAPNAIWFSTKPKSGP